MRLGKLGTVVAIYEKSSWLERYWNLFD